MAEKREHVSEAFNSIRHGQFRHASRCLAVKRIVPTDQQELDVAVIVNLFDAVKKAASAIGKVRNAFFHHSGGGQILIEFCSPEEAAAARNSLDGEKLSDVTLHCSLVEMIPEMRKGEKISRIDSKISPYTCSLFIKAHE